MKTYYVAKCKNQGSCGHRHKTPETAALCLGKLQGWHNAACDSDWYYGAVYHVNPDRSYSPLTTEEQEKLDLWMRT